MTNLHETNRAYKVCSLFPRKNPKSNNMFKKVQISYQLDQSIDWVSLIPTFLINFSYTNCSSLVPTFLINFSYQKRTITMRAKMGTRKIKFMAHANITKEDNIFF